MPSKRNTSSQADHSAFEPLLIFVFIIWVVYRVLFDFPVWFDEVIGKALFFGFPVWIYSQLSRSKTLGNTFSLTRLQSGLFTGLALGGTFGFAASLLGIWQAGGGVQPAWLFTSPQFWWEFLLALFTAFWETIFFFSFVMVAIQEKKATWSLWQQVLTVAVIFLAFHIPNTLARFTGPAVIAQFILLFLFALGQALFFARRQNGYALVLSHAIWGMVLLVHLT